MTDNTDKIDLIEQAVSIISCGGDYRGILDIDKAIKLKSLFIESDDAREYWREHDTEEPNVLLATHIKRLKTEKKRFVEQTVAVAELEKCGANKDDHPTDRAHDKAIDDVIAAIRALESSNDR